MLRKCKYCKKEFFGKGYFCSDVCEIKDHASVLVNEIEIVVPETKEEIDQVEETSEN